MRNNDMKLSSRLRVISAPLRECAVCGVVGFVIGVMVLVIGMVR